MLTKEVARERLAKWRVSPTDAPQFSTEGTRFRKAIEKLPAKLAKITFDFYAIDAAGKATGSPQLQWETAIQFDRLTSRERTTILQIMFPRMVAGVEQTWVALRATDIPRIFRELGG